MFSVPLNPKLSQEQFATFIEFLKRNKSLIYDVYFTSRIPPFMQDAMGDVFNETQYNLINEIIDKNMTRMKKSLAKRENNYMNKAKPIIEYKNIFSELFVD